MGNRSRRRRHQDGSIEDARPNMPPARVVGSMNDPLYGIPDTNMPHLAGIRMARALSGPSRSGRRSWRRGYAVLWLFVLVVGVLVGSFGWATGRWP